MPCHLLVLIGLSSSSTSTEGAQEFSRIMTASLLPIRKIAVVLKGECGNGHRDYQHFVVHVAENLGLTSGAVHGKFNNLNCGSHNIIGTDRLPALTPMFQHYQCASCIVQEKYRV